MLKTITIQGFRGVDCLRLEDFARVNLLVGPNGGGKTTALEALCLAPRPFALDLLDRMNQWRDMPPLAPHTWHTLLTVFSQMDPHREIRLEVETSTGSASARITAMFGVAGTEVSEAAAGAGSQEPVGISTESEETIRGVSCVYRTDSGQEVQAVLELVPPGYRLTATTNAKQPPRGILPGAFFIHARRATSLAETADTLTRLYEKQAEQRFIEALRRIEPRLRRLVPGTRRGQPTVLADLGSATLVPINILGDGFCRASLIATGLASPERGRLLLVDEIDSGLHRTVMCGVWESLYLLAEQYGVQVFCTTHNEEMLREALSAFAASPDALRVFRLSRDDQGVVTSQRYDYGMLHDAQVLGMDVR